MFTYNNKPQTNARIWQQQLENREALRNTYHATNNLKKAKEFLAAASRISFEARETMTEHIIFASDALLAPLRPAFAFARIASL